MSYLAAVFALTWGLAGSMRAAVDEPWVATDRTVDSSSMETVVAQVCKDCKTDEEKALALFYWFRQTVYHYRNMPESRIPLKTVNVIGNTLCGSQATCMKGFLQAAGIKARVVSHPGHTFYEAFYDNAWHGFDTFTNFFVWVDDGNGKRHIASFEETSGNPAIIDQAVAEKRNAPNWCPCGDAPAAFKSKISINDYVPATTEWSVKDYSLRPGEEVVRSWWPMDKPLPGTANSADKYPHHTCGGKDADAEPFLFKFWEPYLIRNYGRVSRSYRHYFNGMVNYAPNLTNDEFKDRALKVEGPAPTENGLAGAGTYVFPVKTSFYITGGVLLFEATNAGEGDSVAVSASVDGAQWTALAASTEAGAKLVRVPLDAVIVKPNVGLHAYQLKFELKGKAVLNHFYARTYFQHNAMAAPHLMPGKNTVTLTVKDGAALAAAPVSVIYRYKDAPAWNGEIKSVEHVAKASPATFTVELPETGEKLPQMQDLTLRCGTLAWFPKKDGVAERVFEDFSKAEAVQAWGADKPLKLSHDGAGMLIESDAASPYPQASRSKLAEDWSAYKDVVIEIENLGPAKQEVQLRVRSHEDNAKRTDVPNTVSKGKSTWIVPLSSLTKTDLKSIDKIYFMTVNVPAEGCKIRVTKMTLRPSQEL
ncbi:MAG: hypothetical protein KIS92_19210 [Planctomycetota bacterium]|nr:hypothetical protein [Planctomycetota bacterium]